MYSARLELTEKQMDTAHSYCSIYMLPVTVKKKKQTFYSWFYSKWKQSLPNEHNTEFDMYETSTP